MTQEWLTMRKLKNKAVYRLKMLEQYIGWIKKDFDYQSVMTHLKEKGVDNNICWAVHKLLYHGVGELEDVWFLEKAAEEYLINRLPAAMEEWEAEREKCNINKL